MQMLPSIYIPFSYLKYDVLFIVRIEGRVQWFAFVKDKRLDLDEQRERQLTSFAEENKLGCSFHTSMKQHKEDLVLIN